jgi:hypothetical protein
MDAANLYAVLTILATLMMAPTALLMEGAKFGPAWDAALKVRPIRTFMHLHLSTLDQCSSSWPIHRGSEREGAW